MAADRYNLYSNELYGEEGPCSVRAFTPACRRYVQFHSILGDSPPGKNDVLRLEPGNDFLVFQGPLVVFIANHLPNHFSNCHRR